MNKDIRKLIGEKIRVHRKNAKYSIEQLSELIYKSKSSISKYENGEVSIDIETLNLIAQKLNVPIEEFFRDISSETVHPLEVVKTEDEIKDTGFRKIYHYVYDGRSKEKLRRSVLLIGKKSTVFYSDVDSFDNYTKCRYYYTGEVQRYNSCVRIILVNPSTERDLIIISIFDPLNNDPTMSGFFNYISSQRFKSVSLKCMMSTTQLKEDDELYNSLILSKEELKLIKRSNMFILPEDDFLFLL